MTSKNHKYQQSSNAHHFWIEIEMYVVFCAYVSFFLMISTSANPFPSRSNRKNKSVSRYTQTCLNKMLKSDSSNLNMLQIWHNYQTKLVKHRVETTARCTKKYVFHRWILLAFRNDSDELTFNNVTRLKDLTNVETRCNSAICLRGRQCSIKQSIPTPKKYEISQAHTLWSRHKSIAREQRTLCLIMMLFKRFWSGVLFSAIIKSWEPNMMTLRWILFKK